MEIGLRSCFNLRLNHNFRLLNQHVGRLNHHFWLSPIKTTNFHISPHWIPIYCWLLLINPCSNPHFLTDWIHFLVMFVSLSLLHLLPGARPTPSAETAVPPPPSPVGLPRRGAAAVAVAAAGSHWPRGGSQGGTRSDKWLTTHMEVSIRVPQFWLKTHMLWHYIYIIYIDLIYLYILLLYN